MTGGQPREPAWVYESIVSSVPGLSVGTWRSLAVQFLGFEIAILGVGVLYGLPAFTLLAGTVTVAVASVGSAAMVAVAEAARAMDDRAYSQLLLGSRIELVLGLVAFVGLVTYLFVLDPPASPALLDRLFGPTPPAVAVFVLLLVLWDVCYRIGAAWWASVIALWQVRRGPSGVRDRTPRRRTHRILLGFGGVQIALLPFVLDQPPLVVALCGHVAAVGLVTGTAVALERRGKN